MRCRRTGELSFDAKNDFIMLTELEIQPFSQAVASVHQVCRLSCGCTGARSCGCIVSYQALLQAIFIVLSTHLIVLVIMCCHVTSLPFNPVSVLSSHLLFSCCFSIHGGFNKRMKIKYNKLCLFCGKHVEIIM